MKVRIRIEIVDEFEREKRSDHHVEYDYYYPEEIFVVRFWSKNSQENLLESRLNAKICSGLTSIITA